MNKILLLLISLLASATALATTEQLLDLSKMQESKTSINAILIPADEATLASNFTSEITKISVKEGDSFKKGTPLIIFDCSVKQAEMDRLEAELEHTKANLDSAVELDKLKAISKIELAKTRSEHKKVLATIKHLKAELRQCQIKAPYDGKAGEIYAHENEDVNPGQPLMRIIDNQKLEVKFYVPSTWLSQVKPGAKFQIKFRELAAPIMGHVVKTGAQIDAASQTINVFGVLDQDNAKLVSGMSGTVTFIEHKDKRHDNGKHQ